MIVADTNLIVYLLLRGENTEKAEIVFSRDSHWVAPFLWRSEFGNVLAHRLRRGLLLFPETIEMTQKAEQMMTGREYEVSSAQVLTLAAGSGCSAYDCEFVALAEELDVPLVTSDREVLKEFPAVTVSLDDFVS